jgi:hypothetical protein
MMRFKLSAEDKAAQWNKLREIARCDKTAIMHIKAAADPARHGDAMSITSVDRETLFSNTWDIVDRYIENV